MQLVHRLYRVYNFLYIILSIGTYTVIQLYHTTGYSVSIYTYMATYYIIYIHLYIYIYYMMGIYYLYAIREIAVRHRRQVKRIQKKKNT